MEHKKGVKTLSFNASDPLSGIIEKTIYFLQNDIDKI